jgi:uncharacterized protein (UPF0332 family)
MEAELVRETMALVRALLLIGVGHPLLYRMLIGRMYYAAHHLGRRLLIEIGVLPDEWRQNVHRRVLEELERHYVSTGRMSREALDALSELRTLRIAVDYELSWRPRLSHVHRALELLELFANEGFRILWVS